MYLRRMTGSNRTVLIKAQNEKDTLPTKGIK
jgi:hypothetical protein